ncbi:unnamed protein product [Ambrosiozyma monospora]|uniref:Unnamed protein product n=1 Tax=Ambrosiozyma monospora TaxID=43982 RepID=A0A9W7DJS4_AMBMO|nr:unnamed protein product [Ambrosiozyma monospora]
MNLISKLPWLLASSIPTNSTLDLPLDDEYCDNLDFFVRLFYYITGECHLHFTRKELIHFFMPISEWSGYISMTAWLFAQLPQVIKNYSDKSVDGLSVGFLLCWFGGDFLNFTSCLLTDAMLFQLLLSGYYCTIDLILAGQFYYYSCLYHNPKSRFYHKKRVQRLRPIHRNHSSPRSALRDSLTNDQIIRQISGSRDSEIDYDDGTGMADVPAEHITRPIPINYSSTQSESTSQNSNISNSNTSSRRGSVFKFPNNSLSRLISTSFVMGFSKVQGFPIEKFIEVEQKKKKNNSPLYKVIMWFMTMDSFKFGKILAWSCTGLYLSSRIPQLMTNYKLRSTKGVSIKLIIAALIGNIFYSTSLLTCKSALLGGEATREFWGAELSYLIGAIGTVIFDICLLLQWYYWDYKGEIKRQKRRRINEEAIHQREESTLRLLGLKSPSSPINFTRPLSPTNVRKLSENTPLSPMDLLLDDYMQTAKSYQSINNTSLANPYHVSLQEHQSNQAKLLHHIKPGYRIPNANNYYHQASPSSNLNHNHQQGKYRAPSSSSISMRSPSIQKPE